MANNAVISLVDLDPNTNKQAFINYLKGQSRFAGYDFAGDDMNVLLDVLMIDFFRNAFFLNMAISEGFIDSAQIFDSVKSHAKELNYTPSSITSAMANVTVSFNATGQSQPYIIPKGMTFSAQVKNHAFTFSTDETIVIASPNTSFEFTANIFEGIYVKDSYIYSNAVNQMPAFSLTNPNADINSLVVSVFGNNSVVGQTYNLANSLLDLTGNSHVYFLQCSAANGNYEVLFGDGVFGSQPQNGAVVILDYRIAAGDPANGAGLFNINFDPTGSNELTSSVTVTTNHPAIGGAPAEDIESTRFYAPRWFQVQERAIVPTDYEIILKKQFPEIKAINAYGGEKLKPPQFGKVVIAVNINNVVGLPISKVQQYTNFIKGRNPLSIQPIFVAANNMYIGVTTNVKYNINITTATENLMESIVATSITNFVNQNLNDFDVTFYYSQFTDMINNADPSIVSNLTAVNVYQKIQPSQTPNIYFLSYNIPLNSNFAITSARHANNVEKTLTSSNFTYKGNLSQLEDDGNGTIRVVNIIGADLVAAANVGTINYSTGLVQLSNFSVDQFSGDDLLVYVTPDEDDITVKQNVILSIEPAQTKINITQISL